MVKEKKIITKKDLNEMRAWQILIPRIEDILDYKIATNHKCLLIRHEINEERRR